MVYELFGMDSALVLGAATAIKDGLPYFISKIYARKMILDAYVEPLTMDDLKRIHEKENPNGLERRVSNWEK